MIASHAYRIVSLVPSLTETLCYFGLTESLVGCTNFCIEPKSLRKKVPAVGGTKDARIDLILNLNPTHVITNREENTQSLLNDLREKSKPCSFHLIETFLEFPEDNFTLIKELGSTFGFTEAAELWCLQQGNRLTALRQEMHNKTNFKFTYFIWMNPWMIAGNQSYISRCLELIGGENTFVTGNALSERYPAVTATDSRIINSKYLLFSSEPFPFKFRHMEKFQEDAGRKFICLKVDGQALSWYGSRFATTLDELEVIRAKIDK